MRSLLERTPGTAIQTNSTNAYFGGRVENEKRVPRQESLLKIIYYECPSYMNYVGKVYRI